MSTFNADNFIVTFDPAELEKTRELRGKFGSLFIGVAQLPDQSLRGVIASYADKSAMDAGERQNYLAQFSAGALAGGQVSPATATLHTCEAIKHYIAFHETRRPAIAPSFFRLVEVLGAETPRIDFRATENGTLTLSDQTAIGLIKDSDRGLAMILPRFVVLGRNPLHGAALNLPVLHDDKLHPNNNQRPAYGPFNRPLRAEI